MEFLINGDKEFFEANGYVWDYCLVFKINDVRNDQEKAENKDPEIGEKITAMIECIRQSGLETHAYFTANAKKKARLFLLVRAALPVLHRAAAATGRRVELDPQDVRDRAEKGFDVTDPSDPEGRPLGRVVKFAINDAPEFSKYHPYAHIHAKFVDRPTAHGLYRRLPGMAHVFASVVRCQLLQLIVRRELKTIDIKMDHELAISDKSSEKLLLAEYPLHDAALKRALAERWVGRWAAWLRVPLTDVKDYMGEKVAMYFAFMAHYARWQVSLVAGGVAAFLLDGLHPDKSNPWVVAYSVGVALWVVGWLQSWRRREAELALKWGTHGVEDEEVQLRPSFQGKEIQSPVDGSQILYFPADKRRRRAMLSLMIITTSITVVISAVVAIFGFRYWLVVEKEHAYGSYIGSGMNAMQIQLFNILYSGVATWVVNMENHRTDIAYENSYIGKLFLFQFVNSMSSFFYIAFFPTMFGKDCEGGADCMDLLGYNLMIIYLYYIIVGNLQEVGLPWLKKIWKQRKAAKGGALGALSMGRGHKKFLSPAEKEFLMEPYDVMMGTLTDYSEIAVQFGYLTLFVAAWPMAPLFGLAANLVELRSDAYKLLHQTRRPLPVQVQDIGSWYTVFKGVSLLAVATNGALVCFVMDGRQKELPIHVQVWLFLGLLYAVYGLVCLVETLVPDVPADVSMQLQRQDFLVKKLIHQIPDEERATERNKDSVGQEVHIHEHSECNDEFHQM